MSDKEMEGSANDFDWLMRGKVHHEANSRDFEDRFDEIHWNESKLTEVARKGNHKNARHFVFDPGGQEEG